MALFRNVAREFGEPNQRSIFVPDRIDDLTGPEDAAVFASAPPLGLPFALLLGSLQRAGRYIGQAILIVVQHGEMLAEDLVRGIALEALGSGVPTDDGAF